MIDSLQMMIHSIHSKHTGKIFYPFHNSHQILVEEHKSFPIKHAKRISYRVLG